MPKTRNQARTKSANRDDGESEVNALTNQLTNLKVMPTIAADQRSRKRTFAEISKDEDESDVEVAPKKMRKLEAKVNLELDSKEELKTGEKN